MNLREIDRLVAEKVMGCEEAPSIWFDDYDKSKKYYCISVTPDKEISIIEYVDRGWVQYLFHPSENIADAWQVVEKLTKDGDYIFTLRYDVNWRCEFFDTTKYEGCSEENPALAICLAALKAVGVEVEGMELREKGICPTCKGKGSVDVYDNSADDVIPVPCPDCCEEREGEE